MDLKQVESQVTEFKPSWRDEYLKWICAFVNTIYKKREMHKYSFL